jgi:hypothetical protein
MNVCIRVISVAVFVMGLIACQGEVAPPIAFDEPEHSDEHLDDVEQLIDDIQQLNCRKATKAQISVVNKGNRLANDFMAACYEATGNSPMCSELARPNPVAKSTFSCTYGASQVHQLIHPDTKTWKHAFKAVWLIQQLQAKNIKVCEIYNWWRPEPYNVNVGGAPGRHPFGTSVDVSFCTKADQERAHTELCKFRAQGHLRALGHYPGTGLHFGVGDSKANTWGKGCT